jgi:hypothetical protein
VAYLDAVHARIHPAHRARVCGPLLVADAATGAETARLDELLRETRPATTLAQGDAKRLLGHRLDHDAERQLGHRHDHGAERQTSFKER